MSLHVTGFENIEHINFNLCVKANFIGYTHCVGNMSGQHYQVLKFSLICTYLDRDLAIHG